MVTARVAQMVQFLPSKHESLSSTPVPQKKKKKKTRKKGNKTMVLAQKKTCRPME
jgi:hypothetical protein